MVLVPESRWRTWLLPQPDQAHRRVPAAGRQRDGSWFRRRPLLTMLSGVGRHGDVVLGSGGVVARRELWALGPEGGQVGGEDCVEQPGVLDAGGHDDLS